MRRAVPMRPVRRRRSGWFAPVAVLVGMLAGAGIYELTHQRASVAKVVAAPVPAPLPATQPSAPPHVDLKALRDGSGIRLYWDRNSPVIRSATKATLYITDGNHQSVLKLDPRELSSGLVSYWPDTKEVAFRLETFGPEHSTVDYIRVVGGPSPAVATAATAQGKPAANQVEPAPKPPSPPQGDAARTEPHSEVAAARPSPFTPAPKPEVTPAGAPPASAAPATPTKTAAAPPKPAPKEFEPKITVAVEPVKPSRFGTMVGHIPLLKRLKKHQQAFVPPAPVREVRPQLDGKSRRTIDRAMAVDVRVFVTAKGKVEYAELLRGPANRNDLAALAVYTARKWEFAPARLGDEKMPGEVILHFKFSPEEASEATQ